MASGLAIRYLFSAATNYHFKTNLYPGLSTMDVKAFCYWATSPQAMASTTADK
jgi:hypothetical protein